MTRATIVRLEEDEAYVAIGGEELRGACRLPRGEAQEGDDVLVEKVSGCYTIVTVLR